MGDNEQANRLHRVLVTGATGAVGRPVCEALRARGHYVRGLARRDCDWVDDMVRADLADRAAIDRAVESIDTVVHLAAYPNPADFLEVLLAPNVVGLYHILEASRHGESVRRVVLASTLQVSSGVRRKLDRPIRIEDGVAPTNHYGLTKVWAEVAGEMYARCYELSVIAARICWMTRNLDEVRRMLSSRWGEKHFLSHDDTGRFHVCAVEAERPGPGEFAALHAISLPREGESACDWSSARDLIGFEPRDRFPEGLSFAVPDEVLGGP